MGTSRRTDGSHFRRKIRLHCLQLMRASVRFIASRVAGRLAAPEVRSIATCGELKERAMISRLTVLVAIFAVPTTTTSSLTFAASSHHDALKDTSSTWGATMAILPTLIPRHQRTRQYGM